MPAKRSKSDMLYRQVQSDILNLRLEPGEQLRMPALSEKYDIGLTPLRECLNRLSGEHLVVPEHNRGFHVAPLSLDELLDIERTRSDVEGSLLSDAISHGDDAWETVIVGTFHHLSKTPIPCVSESVEAHELWTKRHDTFHDALVSAAPSVWKHRFRNQLMLQLSRYHLFIQNGLRDLASSHPDIAKEATIVSAGTMTLESHEALYNVALDRNAANARRVFSEHSNISISAFQKLKHLWPESAPTAAFMQETNEETRA